MSTKSKAMAAEISKQIEYLAKAMKAPRIREAATRLAGRVDRAALSVWSSCEGLVDTEGLQERTPGDEDSATDVDGGDGVVAHVAQVRRRRH